MRSGTPLPCAWTCRGHRPSCLSKCLQSPKTVCCSRGAFSDAKSRKFDAVEAATPFAVPYLFLQLIVEDHRTVHHYDFCTQERHVYAPKDTRPPEATSGFGHGGADWGLMEAFVDAVALDDPTLITSESASAVASHLLTFEAEKSRLESRVVSL